MMSMRWMFIIIVSVAFAFSSNAQISFEDQASSLGLGTTCGTTYLGNGVTFHDFDGDGWDDITLNTEAGQSIRFFKNVNGSFQELTLNIPAINYQTKQLNWVDFDNDGDKDLFITSDTDGNRLYENTGNLSFQDITISSGFSTDNMFSYGASWGDYNNDGYLDVFISNRTTVTRNKLFKNNGDKTFTDVSAVAGILSPAVASFCSAFIDINNDGFQDIYISNDKTFNSNVLYKNNGDGTFSDISISSGTDVSIDAMSVTVGDYNNDGWFDIYVTNNPDGNVLYKNNGDETFTDVADISGTIYNSVGWGASFFDADNDMDIDLYVCGMFDDSQNTYLMGAFYDNNNDESFTLRNTSVPNDNRVSFSSSIGDVDNDGLPDILVSNNNNQDLFLWKNTTSTTNKWLKVNLEGIQSNRDGIGSVIEISVNGNSYYRYTHCGEGYLSQNSGTEMFGIGNNSVVDYVRVTWLSGKIDVIYNVNVNQVLNIVEGSSLSIDNYGLEQIYIYPNPVSNILYFDSNSELSFEIYNVLGKKEQIATSIHSDKIDVSKLKSGLYYLRLFNSKNVVAYKFIKK